LNKKINYYIKNMATDLNFRSEQIMRLLLRRGSADNKDILATVGSSGPSIRRDLAHLELLGLIHRTHGGAELVEPLMYEPFRYDSSFHTRERRFEDEKRRIGLAAADLVQENEIIGLTAGTTTTAVERALRYRKNLKIVTNAINIGMELSNQTNICTFLTGGMLKWTWTFSLIGPAALEFMNDIHLDRLFLSVVGLDIKGGITALEEEEAVLFRKMVEHSRQVVVVADSSKIGYISKAFVCPIKKIDLIITDTGVSKADAKRIHNSGPHVLRV